MCVEHQRHLFVKCTFSKRLVYMPRNTAFMMHGAGDSIELHEISSHGDEPKALHVAEADDSVTCSHRYVTDSFEVNLSGSASRLVS